MLQNAFGNLPLSLIETVAIFFFIWYINDLYKKVSWQWPAAGVVVTVVLALVLSLLNLGRYVESVLITSEVLAFLLSYTLLSKKLKKWQAFIISLAIMFIWAMILMAAVGVLYNIG